MERSVSALFVDGVQVDSAIGALRADGIEAARITVASPDGFNGNSEKEVEEEHHGVGTWLIEHLLRHGHSPEQAQHYEGHVAAGGWLVRVTVRTEEEDRSVRNLLVTAGAKEISGVGDGTMIPINPPVGAGMGKQ